MSGRQSGKGRGRSSGERRKARPPTNRHYPRTARLNALLQQIVADHLGRAQDDRLGFLTVTGVEVDAELGKAVVYLSTLDVDEATDTELLEVLAEEYRKPLQADIARSARLRKTPEVVFALDPAVRTGARIDEILAGLDIEPGDDAEIDPDGALVEADPEGGRVELESSEGGDAGDDGSGPDENEADENEADENEVWVPNTDTEESE